MLLEVGIYNEQAYVIYNNLLFYQHLGLETQVEQKSLPFMYRMPKLYYSCIFKIQH